MTDASIVIACHTERRWASLLAAIASAHEQSLPSLQVIVAVDNNPSLSRRLRAEVDMVEVVDHSGIPGASGTRNAGAARAQSPLLAFLDDDVRAHPDWLAELLAPFTDPDVVGTGGRTLPAWQGREPSWFPSEFGWVVGASYTGLPTSRAPIRNVWSENMAVRRRVFEAVGGFRPGFGKHGVTSRPEDTDLCLRISAGTPGARWFYVPTAVVEHVVPLDRSTLRFFLHRCYAEGAGKLDLSGYHGAEALDAEREFLRRTVPHGVARHLRDGDGARALTILAGTVAVGLGALTTLARSRSKR